MTAAGSPPTDAAVREAIENVLSGTGLAPVRELGRRPSEYRTSFPLEELDLTLADDTYLHLAFKRLDWHGLDREARLAKPDFLHDPAREPAVYESVLSPAAISAPRYYGAVIEPAAGRHWLFVEWVEGRELYQVGDRALWEAAACWLGELHTGLGDDLELHAERGRLLDYDETYSRRWIARAREFAGAAPRQASDLRWLDWLGQRYEVVVDGLLSLPRTVIHGEFYASNVLVAEDQEATRRVAPVDWELAAGAPGVIDLAALVSGDWAEDDRDAIVAAYRSAIGSTPFSDRDLDLARLHLAVQWLGWAPPAWIPPEGQRHDWLAEAMELAERLAI
jgi:thiamine kinase-like enzyme